MGDENKPRKWKESTPWERANAPLISTIISWFATAGFVALIGCLYGYSWLPYRENLNRQRELVFELAFRTSNAIDQNKPSLLGGSDVNYVTGRQFKDQPFHHIMLELRRRTGSEHTCLTEMAVSPPTDKDGLKELYRCLWPAVDFLNHRL